MSGERYLRIDGAFTTHNVGQGLFYSGGLLVRNGSPGRDRAVFLYDCGSFDLPLLHCAIADLVPGTPRSRFTIKLLIISHLHLDHVSGIPQVMAWARVETVILPYLFPWQRLALACRHRRYGTPPWRMAFLADPVGVLLDNGAERVILIPGEGPSEPGPAQGVPDLDDLGPTGDWHGLEEEILACDPRWRPLLRDGRLWIWSHRESITVTRHWIFRFYNSVPKFPEKDWIGFVYCARRVLEMCNAERPARRGSGTTLCVGGRKSQIRQEGGERS